MGQAAWEMDRQTAGLERDNMPHHNTYRRILADGMDAEEFEALARKRYRLSGKSGYHVVVAMDGKVIRGTIDTKRRMGCVCWRYIYPGKGLLWHR